MRFATLKDTQPDGRLHLVSRDNTRCAPTQGVETMQALLENWDAHNADLQEQSHKLNSGPVAGEKPLLCAEALAPLPRAWQWLDGSAFASHGALMEKAFKHKAANPSGLPLMYQGISDRFLSPQEDAVFPSEADDIDFEGEFGIVTDRVPAGTSAEAALPHIRLLVQINDWSLRRLAPIEIATGFGFIQCKPRSSMAPVAVTPDELGSAWADGRIHLPLAVELNGQHFGHPNGGSMSVGFHDLVAHAAYSRDLVAGTVIGSGTVSNDEWAEVGSTCMTERRMTEMILEGAPQTPFLRFGDRVRMEARLPDAPLFGAIDQIVATQPSD
ncbi:fumarylacetoacetate hydrolase family protein [Breoghania sp.]|uniref:fumarylacetoacetate hydrolase family protein n=1 Tax=Breoghania sp. TaxID=2065378 RepID=UPI002AA92F12|nr:fumarylacetoacetate hydrolase family protein [Breoghania sp.]